ncbi:trihydrophobin-like [Penaeus monodon]|uniref:trihydrophobin-like n=1 Tax=Penaeus monodon TaxID=6687 RepID=UPI0018A6FD26|nr:trihydrophobin-like [Penaeus monodon]
MPCAPGTVWNQQKLTCDHEWASPCVTGSYLTPEGLPCGGGSGGNGGGGGDGGNGGGGGDGGNGGGGGDGGNGGNGGSIDGCVIDCSLGKYLPHPSDCRKFIQCAPYGPEEMPCAPGTVWNQQKLTCDHEWASPCVTGSYLTPEGLPCGGGSGGNGGGGGDGGNGGGGGDGGNGDGGNGGDDCPTVVSRKGRSFFPHPRIISRACASHGAP